MSSVIADNTPIQECFIDFFAEYYLASKNEKDFIDGGHGNGAAIGEEIQAIYGDFYRNKLFAKHR